MEAEKPINASKTIADLVILQCTMCESITLYPLQEFVDTFCQLELYFYVHDFFSHYHGFIPDNTSSK